MNYALKWWCTPVNTELAGWRQWNQRFKVVISYKMSFRSLRYMKTYLPSQKTRAKNSKAKQPTNQTNKQKHWNYCKKVFFSFTSVICLWSKLLLLMFSGIILFFLLLYLTLYCILIVIFFFLVRLKGVTWGFPSRDLYLMKTNQNFVIERGSGHNNMKNNCSLLKNIWI